MCRKSEESIFYNGIDIDEKSIYPYKNTLEPEEVI